MLTHRQVVANGHLQRTPQDSLELSQSQSLGHPNLIFGSASAGAAQTKSAGRFPTSGAQRSRCAGAGGFPERLGIYLLPRDYPTRTAILLLSYYYLTSRRCHRGRLSTSKCEAI